MLKLGTAHDLHSWLTKQLGTKESPPNSNQVKYASWARIPGQPWCAAFVSRGFKAVGLGMDDNDPFNEWFFVYTPTGAEIFRSKSLFFTDISKARPSDVVFFHNGTRISHVGFVEENLGSGKLRTIEGNTSSGIAGSQSDGGGVFRRERTSVAGFTIAGFGRLPLAKHEKPAEPVFTFPKRAWIEKGDEGDDVRLLQHDLNLYFRLTHSPIKIVVDGECGGKTIKALKQFQFERGLDVDGRAGQHDIRRLEVAIERRKDKAA